MTFSINKLICLKGYAEALEPNRREEENATNLFLIAASTVKFIQSLLSPIYFSIVFFTNKWEGLLFVLFFYGRFLRASSRTAPTTITAIAAIAMYSVGKNELVWVCCVGATDDIDFGVEVGAPKF